jgi:magnesium-transporting ATPase (P-type)
LGDYQEEVEVAMRPRVPPFLIEYEPPNDIMDKFSGRLIFDSNNPFREERPIDINVNYVCMRGSTLQKTDHIDLLVLYTGHDTKILMSMNNPPAKKSTIERKLLKLIIMIFCVIVVLAIIMSVLKLKTRTRNVYFRGRFGEPVDTIISIFGWILNLTYSLY